VTELLPPPVPGLFPDLTTGQVRVAAGGTQFGRIYAQTGAHPGLWDQLRTFGPTGARFDHHLPPPREQPDRAVLYAAIGTAADPTLTGGGDRPDPDLDQDDLFPRPAGAGTDQVSPRLLYTCVAEVFRDRGVIELSRDSPAFVLFRTVRPVALLDLSDTDWIARAGGNAALTAGRHDTARAWARAIHDRYPDLDGLVYSAATMPAGRSVVLTERARGALPPRPVLNLPLTAPVLRAELEDYGHRLHLPLLT